MSHLLSLNIRCTLTSKFQFNSYFALIMLNIIMASYDTRKQNADAELATRYIGLDSVYVRLATKCSATR